MGICFGVVQLFVFGGDVTEINESNRNKVVSQTHTICNLGVCVCVCVSAECPKISAVCG